MDALSVCFPVLLQACAEGLVWQVRVSDVASRSPELLFLSRPALDRAVHAVVASYVRQLGDSDQAESPYPFPAALIAAASELLEQRASLVDPDELPALQRILCTRSDEWQRWQRLRWSGALHAEDMPLMRPAGAYVPPDKARVSWATPQSLRNVDAECQVEITQLYMLEEGEDA